MLMRRFLLLLLRRIMRMRIAVGVRVLLTLVMVVVLMSMAVRKNRLFGRLAILENPHAGGRDSATIGLAERERGAKVESFYCIMENFCRNTGVDKRSEKHIAADASEAIEISDAHGSYCFTVGEVMAVAGRMSFIEPER